MKLRALMAISIVAGISCGCGSVSRKTSSPAAAVGQSAELASSNLGNTKITGRTIWVPSQVGTLLGAGYVRVTEQRQGADEEALVSSIQALDIAEMSPQERLCALEAVARLSGRGTVEVQSEQDRTGLPLGEWLAFNTIARYDQPTLLQLVVSKGHGESWTQLAASHDINIATVTQTLRDARNLTAVVYSNAAERIKGDGRKWHELGVHPVAFPF